MSAFNNGNIQSSRVFLNAFGFVLQDSDGKEIAICDRKDKQVGNLLNGRSSSTIEISSKNNDKDISMSAKVTPCYINSGPVKQTNKIDFSFSDIDASVTGKMTFATMVFNSHCSCRSQMEYLTSDGKQFKFSFNKKDSFFCVEIKNGDTTEKIYMNFTGKGHRGIIHETIIGEYNTLLRSFPSYEMVKVIGFEEKSKSIMVIREKGKIKGGIAVPDIKISTIPKKNFQNLNEKDALNRVMMNAIYTMLKYDPALVEHISDIIMEFTANGVLLGENLVGMCYDNCNDDTINSVFGIDRIPTFYQNDANCLDKAFFGRTYKKGERWRI